jgi:two-component system, cell cycle response regulator DivK
VDPGTRPDAGSEAAPSLDSAGAPEVSRRLGSGPRRISQWGAVGNRLPRVLIVDDDETTREMYGWSMRALGWVVEEVANGQDALFAAALFEPDVLVMDLDLPVLDGIEATRILKDHEYTKHIPIVACTGLGDRARAEARQAGCSAIAVKPFPPEQLRSLIEALVAGRHEAEG